MTTPICDFVERYRKRETARIHMPGHKGKGQLGCEPWDITEICGADALYEADGIIAESEKNASALFGTAATLYSTEGSSQCIRAMLSLAVARARRRGDAPRILAARNVHKTFVYACALLDAEVRWLYPAAPCGLCSCPVTPAELEAALLREKVRPAAVYVTSPDYLGRQQDIAGLAKVCGAHDVPLLVDNAHGAYLKFLPVSAHPIDLGAAACCDSGHKTLPVLTGGAYLHLGAVCPEWTREARGALALFGSTSPSYLILQSLDRCNRTLAEGYPARLRQCAARLAVLCETLQAAGCAVRQPEPLKLVIDAAPMGYTGCELAALLRESEVECEFADEDQLVLMAAPDNTERDFARVQAALCALPARPARAERVFEFLPAVPCMTLREAVFAPHEVLAVRQAVGRVCGSPTVSCPPAVPIAVSGETITAAHADLFERYHISAVEVIAESFVSAQRQP